MELWIKLLLAAGWHTHAVCCSEIMEQMGSSAFSFSSSLNGLNFRLYYERMKKILIMISHVFLSLELSSVIAKQMEVCVVLSTQGGREVLLTARKNRKWLQSCETPIIFSYGQDLQSSGLLYKPCFISAFFHTINNEKLESMQPITEEFPSENSLKT